MPSGLDARHRAAEEQLAPVVHLADRAARPARDGATRHAHAPRIDAQNRVNLGKALTALGWTADAFLVAAGRTATSWSALPPTARC